MSCRHRCGRQPYSSSACKRQKQQKQPFDAYKGKGKEVEEELVPPARSVWEGKDYSYFFKIMNPELLLDIKSNRTWMIVGGIWVVFGGYMAFYWDEGDEVEKIEYGPAPRTARR